MPSDQPKSPLLLQRIIHNPPSTPTPTPLPKRPPPQQQSVITCTTAAAAASVPEWVSRYHTHVVGPNQCCSAMIQQIHAPVSTVWSIVRRFDNPQAYKHFVKTCHVIAGDGTVGTVREVQVISGLPAAKSRERLEILDEDSHVISFSVVGGDHRLANYRSVTTLHTAATATATVVVESYLVDIPGGNTKEETCVFVDTIVRCNLQSLSQIAQDLAAAQPDLPYLN